MGIALPQTSASEPAVASDVDQCGTSLVLPQEAQKHMPIATTYQVFIAYALSIRSHPRVLFRPLQAALPVRISDGWDADIHPALGPITLGMGS